MERCKSLSLNSYFMGFWSELATAAIPSVINGFSQLFTNKSNQNNYIAAQERANAFARSERLESQRYNSLPNQMAQMTAAGMNPNLLNGQSFVASSPVPNQSVMPPQNIAPQVPAGELSQIAFNKSSAENQREQAVTTRDLRAGLIRNLNGEYEFTVANTANAKAQLPVIQKQLDVMETTIADMQQKILESDARTQNVREDTARLRELQGTWRREANARIDNIISSTATNGAERAYLLANRDQLLALAEQVRFQNWLNDKTRNTQIALKFGERREQEVRISTARTNRNLLRFQYGQMETFGNLDKALHSTSQALHVVDQLISLNPAERAKKDVLQLFGGSSSPSSESLPNPYSSGGFGQ